MTEQTERQMLDIDVKIGFDAAGDPMMRIEMPEAMGPDSILRPAQVRAVGVLFIEAAARAEAGATLSRRMYLDGVTPEVVATVITKLLG